MELKEIEGSLEGIARTIKSGLPDGIGFTLFLYEYGSDGWFTYASSALREDMVNVVKEWLKVVERGSPEVKS
jgi:hypothetical protein